MARKILLIVLAVFLTALEGCAEEYLADPVLEPQDFMGVKWGQDVSSVAGLSETYRSEDGDMAVYIRSDDVKLFGRVKLDSIEYVFVRNKLTRGSLIAKGPYNEAALLKEALNTYGKETARVGDDYMWRFTDANVMFSSEPQLEQSVLFYTYLPRK
ncbi:MAG: hypothetical protein LBO21_10740 [Synergistaceae bacterium]|jgi:hypothetical protein|nr:hypothetical protein [Synergistaceae bacterium]